MKIWLVQNRNGETVISWSGVARATLAIVFFYGLGVAGLSVALRWFSPMSLIGLPVLLVAILGRGIKQGLLLPPASLPAVG